MDFDNCDNFFIRPSPSACRHALPLTLHLCYVHTLVHPIVLWTSDYASLEFYPEPDPLYGESAELQWGLGVRNRRLIVTSDAFRQTVLLERVRHWRPNTFLPEIAQKRNHQGVSDRSRIVKG